ncbi:uncharacterized protein LOC131628001 isoform X2 [Vicia villosa]|uniref:uncharacterized protein LOC131628001 isoform X2 n=1 Tax=Vicia villosa TaxID=3911 RepID=UPI00273AB01B|nr:uncharacterized protein LOC131628001 isoform X2 [Vicia villosa]
MVDAFLMMPVVVLCNFADKIHAMDHKNEIVELLLKEIKVKDMELVVATRELEILTLDRETTQLKDSLLFSMFLHCYSLCFCIGICFCREKCINLPDMDHSSHSNFSCISCK